MEKEKKKLERKIKLYSFLEFLFSKVVSMGSIGLFCISFFTSFGTNSLNIISLISLCVSLPIFVTSIWLGIKQANNKILLSDVKEIFLYTENYLFRRSICDLPTNALNKIFLMLHREIVRYDGTEDNYVKKFKYALRAKSDRGRFPDDNEFIEAFTVRPVYQMNSKNKVFKVATLILAIFLVALAAVCSKSLVFAETSEFSDNLGMATDISDADSQNGVESTGEVYSYYDFLPRDVMPILGFVAMPNENGYTMNGYTNPSFITRTHFQTYKDAGFNIISGLYEREPFNTYEIRKAVDLAEELDLVYFVQDLDVRSDAEYEAMKELISSKWYLNKKSFGGISLKDEPSVNDFSSMSKVADVMRELAPGKVTHSTLFPWGASASQLGIYDMPGSTNEEMWQRYEVYVNRYMQEVNPELLAYDSYIFFYRIVFTAFIFCHF